MVRRFFVIAFLLFIAATVASFAYTSADLVFSVNHNDLGADGSVIASWGSFTKTGTTGYDPTVATLLNSSTGVNAKWAKPAPGTLSATGATTAGGSGFTTGIIDGIANTGFTIVSAIIPSINSIGSTDYRSIVNAYLGELGLYQMDNGKVSIRLQKTYNTYNSFTTTGSVLTDGLPTVLSVVINSAGAYEVWRDTVSSGTNTSTLLLSGTSSAWPTSTLLPSVTPTGTTISNRNSIGLGSQGGTSSPASSSFRGYIGDTYLYKTALTSAERIALINSVEISMGMLPSGATYTITGSVKDSANSPISGALIFFKTSANASINPMLVAITDASGNYSQPVPTGTWFVSAMKSRYTPNPAADQSVPVTTANVSGINFMLTQDLTLHKLVDLDAGNLSTGALSSWSNAGTLGGSFAQDGADATANPTVATVSGKKAVTFDGSNDRLLASFTAPAGLTSEQDWTVSAMVYNPAVAAEEAYLCWAQRGTPAKAAEFCYGSSYSANHISYSNAWASVPSAGVWHNVAVTYDGVVEKTYVDGYLSVASATRNLNIFAGQPVMLGAAFEDAAGATKSQWFSGSIASLQVYDEALTASEVLDIATVTISGKVSDSSGPLAGAVVGFKSSSKATAGLAISATADADVYTLTDSAGNYSLHIAKNSSFYVAAWKQGYSPSNDTLVTTDVSRTVNISVTDEAGVNLALGKTAAANKIWASSTGLGTNPINNGFDGNNTTYFNWSTSSQKDLVIDVSKTSGAADSINGITMITSTLRPYDWELWVEDNAVPVSGGTRNISANWTRVYASTGAFGGYDKVAVDGTVINPVRIPATNARGVWVKITSSSATETRPLEVMVHSSTGPRSLGSCKNLIDGEYVVFSGKSVTWAPRDGSGSRTTSYFYAEDLGRGAGIRVQDPASTIDTLKVNDMVSIAGTMATDPVTSERYINAALLPSGNPGSGIAPYEMNSKSVQTDTKVVGMLVNMVGKVKEIVPDGFTISDGYAEGGAELATKVIVNGIQIPANPVAVDDMVLVTGIVGRELTANGVRSTIQLYNYNKTITYATDEITFFTVSDLHYGLSSTGTIADRATIDQMNALPGTAYPAAVGGKVCNPRGVAELGDIAEGGTAAQFAMFATDYGVNGECRLRYPVYEGLGNHDGRVATGPVAPLIRARTTLRRNLTSISTNSQHYSWDWGGVHFVHVNMYPTDIVEASQLNGDPTYSLQFLKADLTANVGSSGRPVVIFQHYGFESFSLGWWSDNERTNYYNAIKNYNVIAIAHGHTHAAGTYKWNGIDVFQDGAGQRDPNPGEFFVFRIKNNQLAVSQRTYNTTSSKWEWGNYWTKTISRP